MKASSFFDLINAKKGIYINLSKKNYIFLKIMHEFIYFPLQALSSNYDHCLTPLGSQSFIVSRPMRNPPTCANHATPPLFCNPELMIPFRN